MHSQASLDSLTDAAGNSAAALRRLFVGSSGASTFIAIPLSPAYDTPASRVESVAAHLSASAALAAAATLSPEKYEVLVGGDAQMRVDTLTATLEDFHR